MSTYFRHTQRLRFKKFLEAFEIITKRTLDLNQMDNEDPNKFYLALIKELKGEGKDLVDLTTTELTQLIQSIEGQFPSIPRECTTTILTDHEFNGLSVNENSIFTQKQEYKLARVKEEILSSKISIYPNPTRSFFTIEIKGQMQQDGLLSVFNANGQLVEKGMITSTKQEWATNNLPSGVYTVIVTIDQAIFKEKLVVIR